MKHVTAAVCCMIIRKDAFTSPPNQGTTVVVSIKQDRGAVLQLPTHTHTHPTFPGWSTENCSGEHTGTPQSNNHSWAMAASALEVAAGASENQLFLNRNLSTLGRKSAQRRQFWAMSICGHCRCHAPATNVFTCYRMKAHHREVLSVDAQGARESVGILSPDSEQLMIKNNVLPGAHQAGTFVDLDPNSTVEADDNVTFLVSCEGCAGLPLGECIDKGGHMQQVCLVIY